MRRANRGRNPQAQQKPTQWRGKIPARYASHPPRIAIKGYLTRTPIPTQESDHRFHRGLFVKILSGLCPQGDRGTCIKKIADLDHMLALTLQALLWRDGANIFAHPSGFLPMALGVHRGGAVLWNESPSNPWCARFSRSFGWSGAGGPEMLAAPGHGEGSRARHEDQAHASSSLAAKSASPQFAW